MQIIPTKMYRLNIQGPLLIKHDIDVDFMDELEKVPTCTQIHRLCLQPEKY